MTTHPVALGAPRDLAAAPPVPGTMTAPLILQTAETRFVETTFDALRTEGGRAGLRSQVAAARNRQRVLKLFQPIQRQFHPALLELWCDTPGTPRLDPARVASAGMVVRRVRRDAAGHTVHEGWMSRGGRVQGWARVERLGREGADPEPSRRLPHLPAMADGRAVAPSVQRAMQAFALEAGDALLQESTTPLFAAPPDVCRDAGRTVYLGLIPTASSEIAAQPAPEEETFGTAFGPESADFVNHLVEPLRGQASTFALAGETVLPQWYDVVETSPTVAPDNLSARPAGLPTAHYDALKNPAGAGALGMRRFILLLRQLASEFDAFGDGAQAQGMRAQLAAIRLPLIDRTGLPTGRTVDAATFLAQAKAVLLEHDANAPRPEMVASWPALPAAQAQALRAALSAAVRARFAAVKGAPGRYDEPGAQYVLRAFVRLKAESPGGCARTLWSAPSEPFVIAPWYEGGGAPPVQVALPNPTPEFLRSVKPNVTFAVPPLLQGLLSGNPKDLADGKGSTGNLTIGWLCSFSLPVITLCAFIVLNIFLSLFDLIFRWMFFIKVCIPFPKSGDGE